MLKPAIAISAKAPISDTGMASSGMMEARSVRKNTKITSATSTAASTIVLNTALIDRSIKTELSLATSIWTPAGTSRLTLASKLRTLSDNSSGLAVACRITPIPMESRPLSRTLVRSSAGPTCTRATSAIRTGSPFTLRITTWPNSAGRCKSVAAVTLNSRKLLSIRPAGTSRLDRRSASSRSWMVSL